MRDDVMTSIYDQKFLDQNNNANQIFLFYKLYLRSHIIIAPLRIKWGIEIARVK